MHGPCTEVKVARPPEFRVVKSFPGLGPVRTAELLPIVVMPDRFQNKRGFWSYGGLGIVTRRWSDWVAVWRAGEVYDPTRLENASKSG
jgi:hypothetical protein